MVKILNLYSGLGGNRALWKNVSVTSVENNQGIADLYRKKFKDDKIVVDDAHLFLIKNFSKFDIVWASPPCSTHTRLNFLHDASYPDLKLYEEIIFLKHRTKKHFVVENVIAYYAPLYKPTFTIGRHNFWGSKIVPYMEIKNFPGQASNFREREYKIQKLKWLGIPYTLEEVNQIPKTRTRQLIDNCVHPLIGLHILNNILK